LGFWKRERVWKARERKAREKKMEMGGEDIRKKVQRVGIETLCYSLFVCICGGIG